MAENTAGFLGCFFSLHKAISGILTTSQTNRMTLKRCMPLQLQQTFSDPQSQLDPISTPIIWPAPKTRKENTLIMYNGATLITFWGIAVIIKALMIHALLNISRWGCVWEIEGWCEAWEGDTGDHSYNTFTDPHYRLLINTMTQTLTICRLIMRHTLAG